MRLSIVIPCYNEARTIKKLLNGIKKVKISGLQKEVIVVDDASTDQSMRILKGTRGIKIVKHKQNKGKGASVIDGLKKAKGDILMIQDADLEYFPTDIPKMLKPIIDGKADVVYGSRNLGGRKSYSTLFFYIGGLFIEGLTNFMLGTNLTDSITGSKAFTKSVYKRICPLTSSGFEIEGELTAKIIGGEFKIKEVPIRYKARSKKQGKNIRWHHAFSIIKSVWDNS